MKTKIFIGLVLSIFGLIIFATGDGVLAAKKARHKPPFVLPVDGAQPPGTYTGPSPVMYEVSIQPDCEDIHPTIGYHYVIQHNQFGSTYYDYQSNGSMGRLIAVGPGGHRHMVFHETRGPYGTQYPRYVTYNCKNPSDQWLGPTWVDGGSNINAGYANIGVMHDGREVIVYHRSVPATHPANRWYSCLAIEDADSICSGHFTNLYDIPDSLEVDRGIWPKMGIIYDSTGTDYVHIVITEATGYGHDYRLGYLRCHLIAGDTLFCETPVGQPGVTSPIRVPPNTQLIPNPKVAYFGECEAPGVPPGEYPNTISAVVATSPVSQRVAIVFTNKREAGPYRLNNDVFYFESTNNGLEWFPQFGGNWPPTLASGTLHNITNYPTEATERAYTDVAACYDYNNNLHIVWNGCYYDSVEGYATHDANLYHWSQATSITLIASGYWGGTEPGDNNRNISKMSISAQDPIYHPDSTLLFVTWTQFDSGDVSQGGYSNGDIYAALSIDGGQTWSPGSNLTNTHTPDCAPGECLSEHWSSLALSDTTLHIQYVCDRDAGGIVMDEGSWTDNPMMYLHLAWGDGVCGVAYSLIDPPSFYDPPIKVLPGGFRIITLQLRNPYTLGGSYEVTTDHPKVTCINNCSDYLSPGESKDVDLQINCWGQEDFINSIITIRCCIEYDERTIEIPLHAVCGEDDYYECMRDERTHIWKANKVCSLWVCCNTEQRVWDKRVLDPDGEIIQPIFSSGVIVATTEGTDTVVGRQDFRDTRTYARDTMIVIQGWMQPYFPAEQCSVQQIRYTRTFVCANNLEPPNHLKWWWMSINEQILMFHGSDCPNWKKEQIVKYVWMNYGGLPTWWPDQTPFADYEDIYLGVFADVDAPFDTGCNGCNTAGYDSDRHTLWQHGYNAAIHPEYEQYYVGLALTDRDGNVVAPLGAQNVLSEEYIYPQNDWGWKEGELYQLAATPGVNIHHPDSVADRTVVLTAGMIPAGSDPGVLDAEFILIEAFIPTGLAALQAHIEETRVTIIPELDSLGMFDRELYLCEDCNGDGVVNIADVVYEVTWLFQGGDPCVGPIWVGDCNSDGVRNIADVVCKVTWLFQHGPPPKCSGFGLHVQ